MAREESSTSARSPRRPVETPAEWLRYAAENLAVAERELAYEGIGEVEANEAVSTTRRIRDLVMQHMATAPKPAVMQSEAPDVRIRNAWQIGHIRRMRRVLDTGPFYRQPNCAGLSYAVRHSFDGQITMFPHMMTPTVAELIERYRDAALGWKLSGAGGGGYLVSVADRPIEDGIRCYKRRTLT